MQSSFGFTGNFLIILAKIDIVIVIYSVSGFGRKLDIMQFNSYIFVLYFLPLLVGGYYLLNRCHRYKFAQIYVGIFSLCFFAWEDIRFCVIFLVALAWNYLFVKAIQRAKQKRYRKTLLAIAILGQISLLLFYKYANFFLDNIQKVVDIQLSWKQSILPLGISFYTFTQIAYLVDCYRGECEDHTGSEYLSYMLFFPKWLQGPIVLQKDFVPQLRGLTGKLDYTLFGKGLYVFALGLSKKVLLADNLAILVDAGYGNIGGLSSWDVILVMICYSLQIYFDFSGYCDMAVGIGYFFGIKLPYNFNSPYKAISISDFWNRWHMTLTQFFTKYVYIPLGGSRKGTIRTLCNIMIVFLLSGLWHGANWTFLIWGAFHGILKVLERCLHVERWKLPIVVKRVITFSLVTIGWSIFRADSLVQAITLWKQLYLGGFHRISLILVEASEDIFELWKCFSIVLNEFGHYEYWAIYFVIAMLLIALCMSGRNSQEKETQLVFSKKKMIVVVILFYWSILSMANVSSFLYVNF